MLKGKTALVTGSTSGIGLGIAKALARQGANIVMNGFGDVNAPKAEIEAAGAGFGVKVAHHNADMSKPAEIADMMAFAAAQFGSPSGGTDGRVDVLVNNAGIQHVAKIEDFPIDKWDAVIAINLSSAFHTTRLALPGMKKSQLGPHHQHRLGARPGWLAGEVGLCRGQTRPGGPDQGYRAGNRDLRRNLQRDLPGLGVDALGAETDRRQSRRTRHQCGCGKQTAAGREKSRHCSSPHRMNWATSRYFSARQRATTSAVWRGTWTAAGSHNRFQKKTLQQAA